MKNVKFHQIDEEGEEMKVAEPVAVYGTSTVTNEPKTLPDDILIGAARYTETARCQGRMIPNEEVYERISERKSTCHLDKAIAAAKDSPLFEANDMEDLMKALKE